MGKKKMITAPETPEGLSEYEAFHRFARMIVNVPKEEVDRLEAEEKERKQEEKETIRPPSRKKNGRKAGNH